MVHAHRPVATITFESQQQSTRQVQKEMEVAGREGRDLGTIEKHILCTVYTWTLSHRHEAKFERVGFLSDMGQWTWDCGGYRIELLRLIRGSMVSGFKPDSKHSEFAFVWNHLLGEWNDVQLPSSVTRSYLKVAYGIPVNKTRMQTMLQRVRIARRILVRKFDGVGYTVRFNSK